MGISPTDPGKRTPESNTKGHPGQLAEKLTVPVYGEGAVVTSISRAPRARGAAENEVELLEGTQDLYLKCITVLVDRDDHPSPSGSFMFLQPQPSDGITIYDPWWTTVLGSSGCEKLFMDADSCALVSHKSLAVQGNTGVPDGDYRVTTGWKLVKFDVRLEENVGQKPRTIPPGSMIVMTTVRLCARSWLSGNLGKTALRLLEINRMYYDTSLKTSRRD